MGTETATLGRAAELKERGKDYNDELDKSCCATKHNPA